jgi:hypothetical protein
MSVRDAALEYTRAGLSVIPIRGDGSKAPALPSWKEYQTRVASEGEVEAWFGGDPDIGLAVIGMNGVEVLDFDQPHLFREFHELVEDCRPGLVARLPQVETPSGNTPGTRRRSDGTSSPPCRRSSRASRVTARNACRRTSGSG